MPTLTLWSSVIYSYIMLYTLDVGKYHTPFDGIPHKATPFRVITGGKLEHAGTSSSNLRPFQGFSQLAACSLSSGTREIYHFFIHISESSVLSCEIPWCSQVTFTKSQILGGLWRCLWDGKDWTLGRSCHLSVLPSLCTLVLQRLGYSVKWEPGSHKE